MRKTASKPPKEPDPDAGLVLMAVRELTAGNYGAIFEVGKQIICPCEGGDQYVASLELEKGKSGAIIRYKDGTKVILRAPLVALYRNPVSLEALAAPAEGVPAEAPPEPVADAPEDIPPPGFLDGESAPTSAAAITSPLTG